MVEPVDLPERTGRGGVVPWTERKTRRRALLDLCTGRYPAFLCGAGLGRRRLPVFHFHEVTPERLEPQLRHLAENGYQTVQSAEMAALVLRGVDPGPQRVALCFDDAWASLWTVAAPLLRRYNLRAIAYVSPALVPPDTGTGTCRPAREAEPGPPFATWPELRALHAEGVVEIAAHGLRHAVIPCAPAIEDFVRPGLERPAHRWPWMADGDQFRFLTPADLGAPLFAARARLSDARAWWQPAAMGACRALVAAQGADAFFARPHWRAELTAAVRATAGRYETSVERDAAMLTELRASREWLTAELGAPVRHMCFPFAVAGTAAVRLAAVAGYETAFADRLGGRRIVRAGDPPYQLMRLKNAYVRALPGTGRRLGAS